MIHETKPANYREHEICVGTTIGQACAELVERNNPTEHTGAGHFIQFNDVFLTVSQGETAQDLVRQYTQDCERRLAEYRASPEGIESERRLEENRQLIAEEEKKPLASFSIVDIAAWEKGLANNAEGYGRAVYRFAARWANKMESAIAAGSTVAECADRCASEADIEGITGFQFGAAKSILRHVWQFGGDLS